MMNEQTPSPSTADPNALSSLSAASQAGASGTSANRATSASSQASGSTSSSSSGGGASGSPAAEGGLSKLVIDKGLASRQDLEECLEQQRRSSQESNPKTLADLLVANGVLTQRQLDRLKPLLEEARPPQQQIPGYQLLDKLGAGAMATVYKARQLSLDRIVAIKILPKKHTNSQDFVKRFYAEGRAAAKLNHPNIVQAIDVGKAGEYHYFVMEYVKGGTVFDQIASGKRFSEKKSLEIAIQIAQALAHAHKAGFIHRDVKPKNIMIMPDGTAKLADMGLARAISDRDAAETEQGKAFGTPYYISPEQIRGEIDVDFRADIYSLGATLYHMVTGQVPYEGPNPSAVMHKHLKSDLVPADHLNPSLSAGLCEIIEVCMAKDRDSRYASTADLLEDLQAVASGQAPVQARRKFDLASLTALDAPAISEKDASPESDSPAGRSAIGELQSLDAQGNPVESASIGDHDQPAPFYMQPMFFVAVAGWTVALILLIILMA